MHLSKTTYNNYNQSTKKKELDVLKGATTYTYYVKRNISVTYKKYLKNKVELQRLVDRNYVDN